MHIRPIRTPDDHAAALREIERLWGSAPNSEDGDTLDVLATLVDAYERELPGLPDLDPVELIRVTMDEEGYSQADFAALLGSRSRASEILSRKRALTLPMVHKIAAAWHIPAELLVRPYRIGSEVEPDRMSA
jgi:antitoxin component HigA of HigAB toxin-antitoxin module